MSTQPLTASGSAALPRAGGLLRRIWRRVFPNAGLVFLWVATLIFLLQTFFNVLRLQQVQADVVARQAALEREQQRLADWRQKAAFAETPDFLDSAVKELTLTRDASEIEIQVEPSPVPPVGDVR